MKEVLNKLGFVLSSETLHGNEYSKGDMIIYILPSKKTKYRSFTR